MNNSRFDSKGYEINYIAKDYEFKESNEIVFIQARRTAFIARFIVLRENKPSYAHREIEEMTWNEDSTAEEVAEIMRAAFIRNKDSMKNVDRDFKRALAHSSRTLRHFIDQYMQRATTTFLNALEDYKHSNLMLFGDIEKPENKAWHSPATIRKRIATKKEAGKV